MKLKLKEISMVQIDVGGNKIKVKPYLTTDDIEYISLHVLKETDYIERKSTKEMLVLSRATDIEDLSKYDYNLIISNGIYEAVVSEIKNINEVDSYIKLHESLPYVLKGLSDVLKVTVDGALKDFNENKNAENGKIVDFANRLMENVNK